MSSLITSSVLVPAAVAGASPARSTQDCVSAAREQPGARAGVTWVCPTAGAEVPD